MINTSYNHTIIQSYDSWCSVVRMVVDIVAQLLKVTMANMVLLYMRTCVLGVGWGDMSPHIWKKCIVELCEKKTANCSQRELVIDSVIFDLRSICDPTVHCPMSLLAKLTFFELNKLISFKNNQF